MRSCHPPLLRLLYHQNLTFLGHMIERRDAESRLLKGHRCHISTRERPRRHLRLRFVTIELTRYRPHWLVKLLHVISLRNREYLTTRGYPMHSCCMQLMRVYSFQFIDVTCLILKRAVVFWGLRVILRSKGLLASRWWNNLRSQRSWGLGFPAVKNLLIESPCL